MCTLDSCLLSRSRSPWNGAKAVNAGAHRSSSCCRRARCPILGSDRALVTPLSRWDVPVP